MYQNKVETKLCMWKCLTSLSFTQKCIISFRFIFLSFYLLIYLSPYLYLSRSTLLSLYIIYPSIYLSTYLSVLFMFLNILLSNYLSIFFLTIYLTILFLSIFIFCLYSSIYKGHNFLFVNCLYKALLL